MLPAIKNECEMVALNRYNPSLDLDLDLDLDLIDYQQKWKSCNSRSCLHCIKCHFCLALAKAMKTMKKGEKAFLTVKPQYEFSKKGEPTSDGAGVVLPNATLNITMEC
ncbi:peptidyl-prolyl cis-trans isomerase FKBP62 [Olea europaea subsp. europaea]|uniref:peptidylprolyl isomerase n=1 Tax=Olea europaea subsp. europaea TaxID=158383 RepID=A0A8S0SPE5_OLEEU|nr:peptidyl-prolyl cis-trans isomerase FKBP62 [Olea europaea subsp. europaea]